MEVYVTIDKSTIRKNPDYGRNTSSPASHMAGPWVRNSDGSMSRTVTPMYVLNYGPKYFFNYEPCYITCPHCKQEFLKEKLVEYNDGYDYECPHCEEDLDIKFCFEELPKEFK